MRAKDETWKTGKRLGGSKEKRGNEMRKGCKPKQNGFCMAVFIFQKSTIKTQTDGH